jgi:hypothetical protein
LLDVGTFLALVVYAGVTVYMLGQMRAQTRTGQRQVGIAQDSFEATTRPWLSADVAIAGPITLERNGLNVRYEMKFVNYGPFPATNVFPMPRITNDQGMQGGGNLPSIETQLCPETETNPFQHFGATVFPHTEFPEAFDIPLSSSELDKIFVGMPKGILLLHIRGCVEYTSPTLPTKIHHTFFCYDLLKRDRLGIHTIKMSDLPILANEVVLERSQATCNSAD